MPCSAGCGDPAEAAGGKHGRRALERAREIRAQILQRLDADRQADEPVGETGALTRLPVHGRMRHRGRMSREALDPAQGPGEREAFEPGDERTHRIVPALELEGHDGTEAALLA